MSDQAQVDRARRIAELLEELLEPENVVTAVTILSNSERGRDFVARFLVRYVNEERSDALIEAVLSRLDIPWWLPDGLVRRFLDSRLPESVVVPIVRMLVPDFPEDWDPYVIYG